MKPVLTLVTVFLLSLFTNPCAAKIFRIGYLGTPVSGVDYEVNELQTTINNATAGDTIQLYQQYWTSSATADNVNKRLVFLGFGYMLAQNPGLQSVGGLDQYPVNLNFKPGSENSVVQGVYGSLFVQANDIFISRSRVSVRLSVSRVGSTSGSVAGIVLVNNYLEIEDRGKATNLKISNNAFWTSVNLQEASGFFNNNIVSGSSFVGLGSFLIKNNIFFGSGCNNLGSSVIEYNLFAGNCAGSYSGVGNQFNVDMATVFENWKTGRSEGAIFRTFDLPVFNYIDNRFALKAGGPAIGAGRTNNNIPTDAGVFGGEPGEAYRLSGIPAIPSIYKISAPSQSATTNPYTITVSVKSNN